jgi:uncharacterized protein YbjT (DUF2867 family)
MILVTGATGNIGKHVVSGLAAAGQQFRTFSRSAGEHRGDLRDPAALTGALAGVDTVFLLWPGPSGEGAQETVEVITSSSARKVVYVSALAADTGFWGVVEKAIESSDVEWTFLRPGGFATNTLGWAEQIRATGEVRWPYGEAARSLIHEKDIADVAVRALLTSDLAGQRPELTGPANLTQAEQVRQIGEAIGRELRWVELPSGLARQQLYEAWGDHDFVDGALAYWASLVGGGEPVTDTVERITGRPARSYREWADDHAADFR